MGDDGLRPGLEGRAAVEVDDSRTAEAVGSGAVPVLATPEVVALIERAAVAAVGGSLPAGRTTVGSRVEIDHLAPTPVGARVDAIARLESVDGRTLEFSFEVGDPGGTIARGRHRRVVVDRERFVSAARDRTGG